MCKTSKKPSPEISKDGFIFYKGLMILNLSRRISRCKLLIICTFLHAEL